MKITRKVIISLIATALIAAGALTLLWADADVQLSGITVEDAHPNGCVDCHSQQSDGHHDRIDIVVNAIADHPNITPIVKKVPEDCAMCHRPGVAAGALNTQVHRIHYENPGENHFIADYNGECLACHALNTATGEMTVKSGQKNW